MLYYTFVDSEAVTTIVSRVRRFWLTPALTSINQSIKSEVVIVAQNTRLFLGHFTR